MNLSSSWAFDTSPTSESVPIFVKIENKNINNDFKSGMACESPIPDYMQTKEHPKTDGAKWW